MAAHQLNQPPRDDEADTGPFGDLALGDEAREGLEQLLQLAGLKAAAGVVHGQRAVTVFRR